jgi:hypothetical protein
MLNNFIPHDLRAILTAIHAVKAPSDLTEELVGLLHSKHQEEGDVFYNASLQKWLANEVRQRREYLLRREKHKNRLEEVKKEPVRYEYESGA